MTSSSTTTALPADHPLVDGRTAQAPLIRAYRGQPTDRHPVWFMRQAGRSLPEYRKVRAGTGMLEACLTPELAIEITAQPVRRHRVDAAIFFSDIVVPLRLAGLEVEIVPGTGPVVAAPVRSGSRRRCPASPSIRTRWRRSPQRSAGWPAELGATPLIGFAGAPFTLASYLVEGGPSRDHLRTKALMHAEPDDLAPAGRLGRRPVRRVPAGPGPGRGVRGAAVRLLGRIPVRADYAEFVAPTRPRCSPRSPTCRCPGCTSGSAPASCCRPCTRSGADVIGVDHRVLLDDAIARLGGTVPVQGNIDPALLFAGDDGAAPPRSGRAATRGGSSRARGQPRPRGAAGHRSRRAHPAGGVHPRPAMTESPGTGAGRRRHRGRRRDRRAGRGLRVDPARAAALGARGDLTRWRRVARHRVAGLDLDAGAESYALARPGVTTLIADLGLTDKVVSPAAFGAWVRHEAGTAPLPPGGWLGIPTRPWSAPVRRVLGASGAARAAAGSLAAGRLGARTRPSAVWSGGRQGARVLRRLVEPVVAGVHAADPDDLEVATVAPTLPERLRRTGSLARPRPRCAVPPGRAAPPSPVCSAGCTS